MMHALMHAMMMHAMCMRGAAAQRRCKPSASRLERVAVGLEVRGLAASQMLLEGLVGLGARFAEESEVVGLMGSRLRCRATACSLDQRGGLGNWPV